jgi:hypothetical protein
VMMFLRKYWFMLFLATIPCVYVLTLIEPSWERPAEIAYSLAWVALCLNYVLRQWTRIEGKLDAILKKLDED